MKERDLIVSVAQVDVHYGKFRREYRVLLVDCRALLMKERDLIVSVAPWMCIMGNSEENVGYF